ncbi:VOC family protein [Paracraurococcus lichenis]|uniref:VOC family protein n=1 Tax=Paracraurococcus lichenis TaxID=3064888 RepID=A0ABT9EDF6_9PROT|nr:VOC family protein [Paracraurococcus sp. LOR1-02]MDO9714008.1 VOC family protein [Paracraurococcus sp. LOR1-02]
MIALYDVCYVRLGTRDLDTAARFATEVLGLEVAERGRQSLHLRSDARAHTLFYGEGDPAAQAVGFEVRRQEELDAAGTVLEALGHAVRRGTGAECAERRVRDFLAFRDPSGNAIELAWRPEQGPGHYRGSRDAGITAFSHVGLCSTDPARDEHFWTEVCNARVSDRIGNAPLLRIGQVHHAIALFPSPRPGIQHVNHQVESGDDVMRSFYLLRERGIPVVFGPGRHPSSSARFLYFEGPDGMVFEYSCGVRLIADELLYRERQFPFANSGFCQWGAAPRIREFQ